MSKFPVPSVIQCVPQRLNWALQIQKRLDSKLYIDLASDQDRAVFGSLMTFGGREHLHLEDDIILAKNFEQLIQPIISKYQNEVIRFFPSQSLFHDNTSEGKPTFKHGARFSALLCVWIPNWLPLQYIDWALSKGHPFDDRRWCSDHSIGYFLRSRKRKFLCWYPSLVQHRIGVSAEKPRRPKDRISQFFIDELHFWNYTKQSDGTIWAERK